jgi:cytoskeletal protein RodZ
MSEKNEDVGRTEGFGEGFGEYLKRQREVRGFSLEEVAEQTKISVRVLRALEAEDWAILPAEVFVRGFIRCYAEVIGINPEEALLRYENTVTPYQGSKNNLATESSYVETSKRRLPWARILIILLIFVLLLGGYFFFKKSQKSSSESDFSIIGTPPLPSETPQDSVIPQNSTTSKGSATPQKSAVPQGSTKR